MATAGKPKTQTTVRKNGELSALDQDRARAAASAQTAQYGHLAKTGIADLQAASRDSVGLLAAAQRQQLESSRHAAGQALAFSTGGVGGMVSGGGQAAGLRQAGLDIGAQQGALAVQQAQDLATAKQQAAQAQVQGAVALQQMGTDLQNAQQKISFYEQQKQAAMASGVPVSEIDRYMRMLLQYETDPNIINHFLGNPSGTSVTLPFGQGHARFKPE